MSDNGIDVVSALSQKPDNVCALGPYPSVPSRWDEAIAAAIHSGRPEDIPGLSITKPDFEASGHRIVRSFALDRQQRPSKECIPCAMCSGGHPKFLAGAVLWSPDRWLRLIGHKCAAKPEHFGQKEYQRLTDEHDQDEIDEAAYQWLRANILAIRAVRPDLESFRNFAAYLEEQQRGFFRDVSALASTLREAAHRQAGVLTVTERLSDARLAAAELSGGLHRASQSQFEVVSLGRMKGLSFLDRPKVRLSYVLTNIIEALEMIPPASDSESLIEALMTLLSEKRMTITAGVVLRNLRRGLKIVQTLSEAREFVSDDNLETLRAYGADPRNAVGFTLEHFGSGMIRFVTAEKERFALPRRWPEIADIGSLAEIVEVGLTLYQLLLAGQRLSPEGWGLLKE
jgi:hypothetical protein